jgi:putative heme-binding domain-containing protein
MMWRAARTLFGHPYGGHSRACWIAVLLSAALSASLLSAADNTLIAPTEPLSAAEQQAKFKLPEGFEIQLVASEPDIGQPMNLNFDAAGRLWVTSSLEYPYPVAGEGVEPRPPHLSGTGEGQPRDRVTIFEGIGRDGRPRRVTQFATGLNIPIGHLPLSPQSALVYSIPSVWLMTDTDADGVCDERRELITGYGNRDTHGMTNGFKLGLDGWVYACHGFSNTSKLTGSDGSQIEMQSGNMYRFRPDGSQLQQISWGQVNPFGLTFDRYGNLYTADCHSKPLTLVLPGAYYPSFGKPHDGLGFGPAMIDHSHGSTGICGPAWYDADRFPEGFRERMYLCNPVTGRVHRDRLEWTGSSPMVRSDEDLITCEDGWFRPVDIQIGPDGALYVADFYNCIIGHYEVPLNHPRRDRTHGRVWRIVYTGDGQHTDGPPNLTQLSTAELIERLSTKNLTLRTLIANTLVGRGQDEPIAMEAIWDDPDASADTEVAATWIDERLGQLAPERLSKMISADDPLLRTHAAHVIGNRSVWKATDLQQLMRLLNDPDARIRRAVIEAFGRHSSESSDFELLKRLVHATAEQGDHQLKHSVKVTLRNLLRDNIAIWPEVIPLAREHRDLFTTVALAIRNEEAARFLASIANDRALNSPIAAHIAQHGDEESVALALGVIKSIGETHAQRAADLLRAAALATGLARRDGARIRQVADDLIQHRLQRSDRQAEDVRVAASLAADLQLKSHESLLREIVEGSEPGFASAAQALVVLTERHALGAVTPLLTSSEATDALKATITAAVLNESADETQKVIEAAMASLAAPQQLTVAERLVERRDGAELLLQTIERGKASPRLLTRESVRRKLFVLNDAALGSRIEKLTAVLPPEREELNALIETRAREFAASNASAERGLLIYRKQCANCHKIGNEGSVVGPQLDGIGLRPAARLIEDILAPNRNVDAAFRTSTVLLADGRVLIGLVRHQDDREIVLADNQGKEIRLSIEDIDEIEPAQTSLMPDNMTDQLPPEQLHDLIAYLLSQKAATATAED